MQSPPKRPRKDTSWSGASQWYSTHLETTTNTYQREVILPNLLRVLNLKPDMHILDLACGQGFFSRELAKTGAQVTGADISRELINEARKLSPKTILFYEAPAEKLAFARGASFDAVVTVLAVENVENIAGMFSEAARVLAPHGTFTFVMLHPAFRIPKRSSWGWDEETGAQYRRVDGYLTAARSELLVHPGKKDSPVTVSHHRSLQDVTKPLFKAGFVISRLEEWISHRQSEKGPRQKAEDTARKEVPLFLMLEARLRQR